VTRPTAVRSEFDVAFVEVMTAMLHRMGARPNPASWYALRLHTLAGELELSVYDGWLATRFIDPDRANALLNPRGQLGGCRLNPYSGKWNFHFGPEDRVEDGVALVEAELRTITNVAQPSS
jgi:hypothetical protein